MPILPNLFATSSSGIGALGLNMSSFVIQLLTFLIVFLVLKKWAFKPIMRIMDERRKLIESGVKLGEDMKKKSIDLEEDVAKQLHDARLQADKLITSANQEAREVLQTAEESARTKADQITAEAKAKIEQDIAISRKKLEKELVGLVAEATEAIIDEKVDAKKDSELIDKALRQRNMA